MSEEGSGILHHTMQSWSSCHTQEELSQHADVIKWGTMSEFALLYRGGI